MKKVVLLAAGIMILLSGISMAGGPEGVSPSGQDVAVINDVCPTFSWTEADGAVGYRVEVYEAAGDLLTHDDVASVAEPVISVDAGRALSWTPSEGGCLTPGVRYVWYVGAGFAVRSQESGVRSETTDTDTAPVTAWSEGRVFEVSSALTEAGREEVKETVEGYLTNEWKATDSYTEVKEEIKKEIARGVKAEAQGTIGILGYEGTINTFYGQNAGQWIMTNTGGVGPPDYNTFIGMSAGYNTQSGSYYWYGDYNTFIGYSAGVYNTTGYDNTFMGGYAGYYSRTSENTFVGTYAGYGQYNGGSYSTGTGNAFFGFEAGRYFTTAYNNTFMGYRAGRCIETADYNTFVGFGAGSGYDFDNGYCNSTRPSGNDNTFMGYKAGNNLTTGYDNTFMGYEAGYSNTTGNYNTFMGLNAGYTNSTGNYNTFMGLNAGYHNTTGYDNTFMGLNAGYHNTTGYDNTFMGLNAGYHNTTGYDNTFMGLNAGYTNSTGSGNVFLGYKAGFNESGSNKLYIDNSTTSSPLIYGEFDTDKLQVNGNLTVIGPYEGLVYLSDNTTNNTTKVSRMVLTHYDTSQSPVYLFGAASTATDNFVAFGGGNTIGNAATQIDLFTAPNTTTSVGTPRLTIKGNGYIGIGTQTPSYPLEMASGAHVTAGGVWTNASSREYKENIEPLTQREAMDALNGLNPVKFNYKVDKEERYVGFIAEDVPELVATKDRKSLSSMDIVAVLTKVVKEQKEEIRQQRTENRQQTEKIKEMTDKINALEAENQEIRAELLEKIAGLERQIKLMNTVASR